MHFEIETKIFKEAVDITSHASVWVWLTPILENIMINVQYKKIVLTSNNLEMAIEYVIDEWINIKSEWVFTVSSKFLSSFSSLLPDEKLEVELLWNSSLLFKTSSSEIKVKWIEASKFPLIPAFKQDYSFNIPSKILKSAIEKTIFSTAEWNIRPTLAWIFLSIKEDNIIFASTDSFRLSEYKMNNNETIDNNISIIIPSKTALELSRILEENTKVNLIISENQILFSFWNIKVFSRLLNWHFPDYRAFFPKSHSTKWVVLRSELIQALKRVNLISKENNYNTRLNFIDNLIEVSTWDTEIWAWTINIVASIEWENAMAWLNSIYLLEVLNVIKDDYVSLDFETNLSPIVIKWISNKEEGIQYKHIIMPLKI